MRSSRVIVTLASISIAEDPAAILEGSLIKIVEQALRIQRAAGSGDGNKNFHPFNPVK